MSEVERSTVKISNSQIMDFQKCERRFLFAHVWKLKPKEYPLPMERGIFGHGMAELFFKAMMKGLTYEESVEAITPLLQEFLDKPEFLMVYRHVLAIGAKAFQAGWKPISVENNELDPVGYVQIGDNKFQEVEFAYTPDSVFEFTQGPHRGQYFMLDWKFTAQYWNDRQLSTYQQLPKYAIWWNKNNPDRKIRQLGVAMLNTRAAQGATGEGLYLIKWLKITKEKNERIEYENLRLVHRVSWAKKNYSEDEYLRTVDNHQCKMCFFADDICPAELEGRPIDKIIATKYELNTYFEDNYEKEVIDKMEKKEI